MLALLLFYRLFHPYAENGILGSNLVELEYEIPDIVPSWVFFLDGALIGARYHKLEISSKFRHD